MRCAVLSLGYGLDFSECPGTLDSSKRAILDPARRRMPVHALRLKQPARLVSAPYPCISRGSSGLRIFALSLSETALPVL
jgi:hypothetical protein